MDCRRTRVETGGLVRSLLEQCKLNWKNRVVTVDLVRVVYLEMYFVGKDDRTYWVLTGVGHERRTINMPA